MDKFFGNMLAKKRVRKKSYVLPVVCIVLFAMHGCWTPPEYPLVEKTIDKDLYFTQQEYGWAGSMPGKHLHFYKKRSLWSDKEIGYINWRNGWSGDFTAKFIGAENSSKRLILIDSGKVVLDTLVGFEGRFEFRYPH